MVIKITSTHKNESNLNVSDIHVTISEFYINRNANIVSLRTNIYTVDEQGNEYGLKLMNTDPLCGVLTQDRDVMEWATNQDVVSLSGSRYQIQAQLLFELIFNKIAEVNAQTPNAITYELIGFPA